MIEYSDVRYLISKKTVDDRALNRNVLHALRQALGQAGRQPRILEIGAGAGTMLPRLVDWDILQGAHYTLLDRDGAALTGAREYLAEHGEATSSPAGGLSWTRARRAFAVEFVQADVFTHLAKPEHANRYDLIIANAVLDLMDLRPALPKLLAAVKPGGLYWFSINFDGETIFLPELALDEQVMRFYHRTMDERVIDGIPCGDSKSGRHLLQLLPQVGAPLLAAGSSDWIVLPEAGRYPADEQYFLHHIIHTIALALKDFTELDAAAFADWVATRHAQADRGELIYIAHQLDVFGRRA